MKLLPSMSKPKLVSPVPRSLFKSVILGSLAGLPPGLTMLCTMGFLRLFFGWPTPAELIFDRVFPLLTVNFFISSLVKAGGYTPLKFWFMGLGPMDRVGRRSFSRSTNKDCRSLLRGLLRVRLPLTTRL